MQTKSLISTRSLNRETLTGVVAIVIGAGGGIGHEAARALAWMGMSPSFPMDDLIYGFPTAFLGRLGEFCGFLGIAERDGDAYVPLFWKTKQLASLLWLVNGGNTRAHTQVPGSQLHISRRLAYIEHRLELLTRVGMDDGNAQGRAS